jgi:cap2 methyltransferase
MTEISFIVNFVYKHDMPEYVIVYAGAAPGTHITALTEMFPAIKFHLYDPRPFEITESENIKLYNQLFLDTDAESWKGKNVFFISDIRTGAENIKLKIQEGNIAFERSIVKDMEMQKMWVEIIDPVESHLKFRLPYPDILPEYTAKTKYLYGYVFKQAWAPQSSTEGRLVPIRKEGKFALRDYDNKDYEEKMFHHNSVVRETVQFLEPVNNTKCIVSSELGQDYDCTSEMFTLKQYLELMGYVPSILSVSRLSEKITKTIGGGKTLTSIRKRNKQYKR